MATGPTLVSEKLDEPLILNPTKDLMLRSNVLDRLWVNSG